MFDINTLVHFLSILVLLFIIKIAAKILLNFFEALERSLTHYLFHKKIEREMKAEFNAFLKTLEDAHKQPIVCEKKSEVPTEKVTKKPSKPRSKTLKVQHKK